RNSELEAFDAGTASVELNNRARIYDPTTDATIRPMNRVWILEEFSGDRRSVFMGYAERWNANYPGLGFDSISTVVAADELKVLSNLLLPSSGQIISTTSAPIIQAILDGIGNRAPRQLDAGAALGDADTYTFSYTGQTPWAALTAVAIQDLDRSVNAADGSMV